MDVGVLLIHRNETLLGPARVLRAGVLQLVLCDGCQADENSKAMPTNNDDPVAREISKRSPPQVVRVIMLSTTMS